MMKRILIGGIASVSMPKPLGDHLVLANMAFRHSFGAARIAMATTTRTTLGVQIRRHAASNKLGLTTTIQPADPAITPTSTETTYMRTLVRYGGTIGLV